MAFWLLQSVEVVVVATEAMVEQAVLVAARVVKYLPPEVLELRAKAMLAVMLLQAQQTMAEAEAEVRVRLERLGLHLLLLVEQVA